MGGLAGFEIRAPVFKKDKNLFALSKIVAFFISPLNLLLVAAVLAFLMKRRPLRLALVVFLVAVLHSPLGNMVIYPLETRFPPVPLPEKADGIVVLGGVIDGRASAAHGFPVLASGAGRLVRFAILARRFPQAKLVYSGASGAVLANVPSEAPLAAELLVELGLDPARLILEPDSRNTYENLVFSKRAANPQPGETWLVVTSAFHLPRAMGIARKIGWEMIPVPVDYKTAGKESLLDFTGDGLGNALKLQTSIKEWIGLISYYVLGRTSSVFPAPA